MTSQETTVFDFYIEDIFIYAYRGIGFASAFIGAVLNEENIFDIKKWNINNYWELVPPLPLKDEVILEQFKSFIIKNALCDMMIGFERTLIELYEALLVAKNTKNNQPYEAQKHLLYMKHFKNDKFEAKIKKINKIIETDEKNNSLWINLKYIRNCITHNAAKVDKDTMHRRHIVKSETICTKSHLCLHIMQSV